MGFVWSTRERILCTPVLTCTDVPTISFGCVCIICNCICVCMCVCMRVCVCVCMYECVGCALFLYISVYHCILLYMYGYNWLLQVCAVNSAGTGPSSAVMECTTLPDLPGCPLNLSSKERPTTTSLHIQWGELFNNGGNTQLHQ